jgi:Big-like domain-containing protein/pro-kumamolisin-like protein
MTINFSGTAGQVESAFHTSIHNLSVNGVAHIANMSDPQIPSALASVVVGIKQLHDFHPRPLHHVGSVVRYNQAAGGWQRVASVGGSAPAPHPLASLPSKGPRAEFGSNGTDSGGNPYLEEDVAPYDFATIYNVLPLWKASTPITGTGQTIAIAGTSDISASDVSQFRTTFGLPAGLAPIVDAGVNGMDPGICTGDTDICNSGDLLENSLDVEWSGAVATGAQIVLATSGYNNQQNPTNDPIFESSQFVVENHASTSTTSSIKEIAGASILSVSYGLCELGEGTAGNVSYYDLWQSAAAEGMSVFVATGDSGAASCDEGGDSVGNPYSAQFGLTVSGLASTPFNVAVGGTDFSWCQPYYNSSGLVEGCAETLATAGPYWSTSGNNTTAGGYESAVGYVPETPWNDTCMNPIWAKYIETLAPLTQEGSTPGNAEAACDYVQNEWANINAGQESDGNGQYVIANLVDTVGGGGGASGCVVNDIATDPDNPTCTAGATTTGATNGSIALFNDGWQKPSWQAGVTGIPGDGVRDLPDVSFFAGDGELDSASLVCVQSLQGAACSVADTNSDWSTTALEVGGTSVATPPMAGVMALINQKAGAPQGLPNAQLYKLAGAQTYSSCSAESVKNTSASCYFNDIDQGTNTQPCDYNGEATIGGAIYDSSTGAWEVYPEVPEYAGSASPNCAALNSGDTVGTLVSSGTTPGYNAGVGFDLATGLGSLNVANVVNAWSSDAGTNTATMTITPTPAAVSGTINLASGVSLVLAVTVTGSHGTATGSVTVAGPGYTDTASLTNGAVTITVPPGTLAVGSDTLTVTYSGDGTYASTSQSLTVSAAPAIPTVTVTAPPSDNIVNAVSVNVGVTGPGATPSGTVTLSGGTYSSTPATLSTAGTASFTIPAGDLPAGTDTLTASYSGNSSYTSGTGTTTIVMVNTTALIPTITVTPSPTSIDTSLSLSVTIKVAGSGASAPTGSVTITSSGATTGSALAGGIGASLSGGVATITIPGYSLNAGTDTLSAAYTGDNLYAAGTPGTASVTVTASTFALSATTPASVTPGGTATSTITGASSSTNYTGTVTLNSCSLTSSSVASPVSPPTCTASGTITYASGTATGSGTATVSTTSNLAMLDTRPAGKGWLGAGGGAVLAFLVFLGIPGRRRGWRAMLGLVVLLAALGSLSACGGGSVNSSNNTATSAGTYTFTVSGKGNDSASTVGSGTFTVTVN